MTTRRSGRLAALGLTLAVVVSGCSPGPGKGADSSSATPSSAGPSSMVAPSPTSGLPATTSSTSARPAGKDRSSGCPSRGPLPPAGATKLTEVTTDVDGDGRADRVLSYRRPDGSGQVAVELASGATAAVDAGGGDGAEPLSVLGGVGLGGDGDTVLAVVGAGASVTVVGLFQFVECALAQVAYQSGQPAELPVGGAVTHGDGLVCTGDGRLVRLSATSEDGESFITDDTVYRVDGNTAIEVSSDGGRLSVDADGAEIQRHYGLDCPGLERGLGG